MQAKMPRSSNKISGRRRIDSDGHSYHQYERMSLGAYKLMHADTIGASPSDVAIAH